jgi:hypothetical protein
MAWAKGGGKSAESLLDIGIDLILTRLSVSSFASCLSCNTHPGAAVRISLTFSPIAIYIPVSLLFERLVPRTRNNRIGAKRERAIHGSRLEGSFFNSKSWYIAISDDKNT